MARTTTETTLVRMMNMEESKRMPAPHESKDEMLSRLKAMVAEDQQTWDLSPKDVAAIKMAIEAFEHLELIRLSLSSIS